MTDDRSVVDEESERYKRWAFRDIGIAQIVADYVHEYNEIVGDEFGWPDFKHLRELFQRGLSMSDDELKIMVSRYNLVWRHTKPEFHMEPEE